MIEAEYWTRSQAIERALVRSLSHERPCWVPEPTEHHAAVLDQLLVLPGIYGNLIQDAHLAALAIEHGLTMCSTDGGFACFTDLTWLNPLTA